MRNPARDEDLPDLTAPENRALRPSDVSLVPPKPAQRIRTRADDPQNDIAPSQAHKGKGCATPSLLALVIATVQPSPRVADYLNAPQSGGNTPEAGLAPDIPQASVSSASAPVDTVSRPPAPTPTVPSSEQHPPNSHQGHPALPVAQSLLRPPQPAPEASASPDDAPDTQAANQAPPDPLDAGDSTRPADASQAPPTTAQPTATNKTRAPRKTPQWPPPADLRGAKWAYARNWYTKNNGSQADFEQHYQSMTPADRRVRVCRLSLFTLSDHTGTRVPAVWLQSDPCDLVSLHGLCSSSS
ncbi:hypothetical protein BD310DRAFT_818760 [Dichomitus squalens]|uniref:Uncharacterized protein n=1 Tax=Dichomitus squalens TaxID=114155 RepID=A0A4Q9PWB6_9APHY|nr:hypothetical protein BD310DRAFT_818760 [Dichomitus squalens]